MIDTTNPITQNYTVACGWNFLVHYVQQMTDDSFVISGMVFNGYGYKIDILWDSDGFPFDMKHCPSYYYLRLIPKRK